MTELMDQIGTSAGQIYEYLNSNGESSFAKMKKELDLKSNFADLGLGWLAREGRIDMRRKGISLKIFTL